MGTQRLQIRFMQESVEAVVSFVERERQELQSASSIVQLRQKAPLKKPGLRVAGVDREGRLRPIEGLQALLADRPPTKSARTRSRDWRSRVPAAVRSPPPYGLEPQALSAGSTYPLGRRNRALSGGRPESCRCAEHLSGREDRVAGHARAQQQRLPAGHNNGMRERGRRIDWGRCDANVRASADAPSRLAAARDRFREEYRNCAQEPGPG